MLGMHILAAIALVLGLLQTTPATQPSTASTTQSQIKTLTRELLDAYSRKDTGRIMSMFDSQNVLMMGADVAEVAPSRDAIATLLRNDFALWDTSAFGDFKDFYVQSSETMATAFFDVPWEATTGGQSRRFVIRLATVWRNESGEWKLIQVLNAVPTTRGHS